MAAEAPAAIGRYRVTGTLGTAGGATAYRAVDDETGRAVVVKLLSHRLGQTPESAERFEKDAAAARRVDGSNVLRLLDQGREGNRFFLVSESFDGAPLGEVLRRGRLTVQQAFSLWKEILKGLAQAHQRGVVHRDLSPATVLVSPDLSRVKLADFGIGRADTLGGTTGTLTTGEFSLGTLHYLAPEQAEGKAADARSDIYAAGAIFHEMLTGRSPGTKFALPSQLNTELPPDVDVVVLKCLARNPAERYANVTHLLAEVEHLEEILKLRLLTELKGISASTSKLLGGKSEEHGQPTGRPMGLWIGIAVAVLAVAAIVGFLVLR